ncbi:Outer membrane protein [Trichinella pseudospiralis]
MTKKAKGWRVDEKQANVPNGATVRARNTGVASPCPKFRHLVAILSHPRPTGFDLIEPTWQHQQPVSTGCFIIIIIINE